MDIALCENDAIPALLSANEKSGKHLKTIVSADPDAAAKTKCTASGVNHQSVQELIDMGKASDASVTMAKVSPDDTQILMYTSGSTGMPKGVELTHRNIIATIASVQGVMNRSIKGGQLSDINGKGGQERYYSFLPMAHIYARAMEGCILIQGMEIAFQRRNPKFISEDLKIYCPSILPMVPRLLNRFYDVMMKKIGEKKGIGKMIVNKAINSKMSK